MHIEERQETSGDVIEARQMDVARSHVVRSDICKHTNHAVVVGENVDNKSCVRLTAHASSTRESASASATTCCIASGVIGYTEMTSMFAASFEREICPSVYARSPMPARPSTNAKLPIASRWASDRLRRPPTTNHQTRP